MKLMSDPPKIIGGVKERYMLGVEYVKDPDGRDTDIYTCSLQPVSRY